MPLPTRTMVLPAATAASRSAAIPSDRVSKGLGFVRGRNSDRVQVKQGADPFTFRDLDSLNLYGLEAAGAPRLINRRKRVYQRLIVHFPAPQLHPLIEAVNMRRLVQADTIALRI